MKREKCWIQSVGLLLFLCFSPLSMFADNAMVSSKFAKLTPSYTFVSPEYQKLSAREKKDVVVVLSIDGGGMYGIIPASLLVQLEQLTGRPISSLFDVMVGTSTGSILVSSLAVPDANGRPKYTALDALHFYEKYGPEIFFSDFRHNVISLWGLLGPRFPSNAAIKVFSEKYGQVMLSQLLSHVIIPSGALLHDNPFWFESYRAQLDDNNDFYVKDIVAAATATPGVFKPYRLNNAKKNWHDYSVDAGLFVNNPAIQAYLDARELFHKRRYVIISLGTGLTPDSRRLKNPTVFEKLGILRGILPVLSSSMRYQSEQTDYQMRMLSQEKVSSILAYYRFNTARTGSFRSATLGDFNGSAENINAIKAQAQNMIQKNQTAIKQLAEMLKEVKS